MIKQVGEEGKIEQNVGRKREKTAENRPRILIGELPRNGERT